MESILNLWYNETVSLWYFSLTLFICVSLFVYFVCLQYNDKHYTIRRLLSESFEASGYIMIGLFILYPLLPWLILVSPIALIMLGISYGINKLLDYIDTKRLSR